MFYKDKNGNKIEYQLSEGFNFQDQTTVAGRSVPNWMLIISILILVSIVICLICYLMKKKETFKQKFGYKFL